MKYWVMNDTKVKLIYKLLPSYVIPREDFCRIFFLSLGIPIHLS